MRFLETLNHLKDTEAAFEPSVFYHLSRLEPEEVQQLHYVWGSIPGERRYTLVSELVEIAETNFEVDFEPIFRRGLFDDDARIRTASIEGLWEHEDLALMRHLAELVEYDPDAKVRAAAALSLGRFLLLGELGKLPFERCEPVYAKLRDLVFDGNEVLDVRRRALESVSFVGRDEVAHLLQRAYEDPEETMRVSAIFGMGRSADVRWIATVIGELFSVNPEMRYEAARACGELEARMAVSRLSELIDDPDREVQEAALWALGQAGGEQARRLLEKCYYEGDEITRGAAEAALAELEFMYGELDFPFYELEMGESLSDEED
jgi:HEAT repeat protein